MRRASVLAGMALIALLAVPTAEAKRGKPHEPTESARGIGQFGNNNFIVDAKNTPSGPRGNLVVFDPSTRAWYHASVICLRVTGNRATVLGRVQAIDAPGGHYFPKGSGVLVEMEDNGWQPWSPQDKFGIHLYFAEQFDSQFGTTCPAYAGITEPAPFTRGDIAIDG